MEILAALFVIIYHVTYDRRSVVIIYTYYSMPYIATYLDSFLEDVIRAGVLHLHDAVCDVIWVFVLANGVENRVPVALALAAQVRWKAVDRGET